MSLECLLSSVPFFFCWTFLPNLVLIHTDCGKVLRASNQTAFCTTKKTVSTSDKVGALVLVGQGSGA